MRAGRDRAVGRLTVRGTRECSQISRAVGLHLAGTVVGSTHPSPPQPVVPSQPSDAVGGRHVLAVAAAERCRVVGAQCRYHRSSAWRRRRTAGRLDAAAPVWLVGSLDGGTGVEQRVVAERLELAEEPLPESTRSRGRPRRTRAGPRRTPSSPARPSTYQAPRPGSGGSTLAPSTSRRWPPPRPARPCASSSPEGVDRVARWPGHGHVDAGCVRSAHRRARGGRVLRTVTHVGARSVSARPSWSPATLSQLSMPQSVPSAVVTVHSAGRHQTPAAGPSGTAGPAGSRRRRAAADPTVFGRRSPSPPAMYSTTRRRRRRRRGDRTTAHR